MSHPAFIFKHSPDGVALARWRTSGSAYYSIYRPRKDERLSWPSWLTYNGRFTHTSATGRAQDRESLPVKDRRSTTVQRNQLLFDVVRRRLNSISDRLLSCKAAVAGWSILPDHRTQNSAVRLTYSVLSTAGCIQSMQTVTINGI